MNLYVSNVSFHTTSNDLEVLFSKYGEVVSAVIVTDKESGRTKGFGFIQMEEEGARLAMNELQGKEIEGRRLNISIARHKG
jgi:RNA recognition motif-containing protein